MGPFAVKDIFNGERFFDIKSADGSVDPAAANAKMGRVMSELVANRAMDLDGKFSDALRNTLFGSFGEDLGTRNMFRAADVGLMDYAALAKCYGVTPNSSVRPCLAQRLCAICGRRLWALGVSLLPYCLCSQCRRGIMRCVL